MKTMHVRFIPRKQQGATMSWGNPVYIQADCLDAIANPTRQGDCPTRERHEAAIMAAADYPLPARGSLVMEDILFHLRGAPLVGTPMYFHGVRGLGEYTVLTLE